MKWTETITPKQAAEELGVPYHGWMREMDRAWISEDQKYSVMSRLLRTEWGKVEHVTITAAEGIGATRLERACNEMHEFQQRYRTKILTENRKSATDAMREDLKGICDFEVRLPQTKAPRNRREEQLRMAQNEGAEIAWLVMAATTHLTFGFGKERLARLKQETLDNYRQYIG